MSVSKATFRWIAIVLGIIGAALLVLLMIKMPGMALFCVVPGALIGCACVPTLPGRPITLYVAFGIFMGYVFWLCASIVNQGAWLALLPVLLLATGAVWLLQLPSWPSAIFTVVAGLFSLGLAVVLYATRHQVIAEDPEQVRMSALVSITMLALGLAFSGLGFAEALATKPRFKKKKKRRIERVEE